LYHKKPILAQGGDVPGITTEMRTATVRAVVGGVDRDESTR
jgi:hypothetical protein